MLSGQQDATRQSKIGGPDGAEDDEDEPVSRGRPRRAVQQNRVKAKLTSRKHTGGYDSMGSTDDESDATSSGHEWDGEDEDEADDHVDEEEDEDIDMSDNSGAEEEEDSRQSLVVSLRYMKSCPYPPSQDTRNGPALSEDHSIPPMTSGDPKKPSARADSTAGLTKFLTDAPKPTPDAALTQYSRSTQLSAPLQHAVLTEHAAPAQYDTHTNSRPQVGHSGQGMPIAPENDHTPFHPNHSLSEEHPAPTASWSRPGTGVVAPNGTRM